MATFEDIKKVNNTIKTTNIKGKEYAEVNQRIKAFRMLYPEGFIRTGIVSHADGIVIIKAEAGYIDAAGAEHILGTGTAFEDKQKGMINGTSYIENCETSAVGRALGMLGLGIDMSVASYEEVNNAIAQQEAQPAKKPAAKKTEPKKAAPKAEPVVKDEPVTCKACGGPIVKYKDMEPDVIIAATRNQFGRVLCGECAHVEQMRQELAKQFGVAEIAQEAADALQPPFIPRGMSKEELYE